MNPSQVQYAFFNQLSERLREAGVSSQQLLDELAVRGITDPLALEGGDGLKLIEAAVDLSKDPCIMIRLGQQLGVTAFGSFGFALMSCANVREAIELLLRYGHVLFRPAWSAVECEGALLMRPDISIGTARQQQLWLNWLFRTSYRFHDRYMGAR